MSPEPQKGRAPSIRDVARLAEVSHQTVSRVLNGHPSIRDETRQRVLDAMEALKYRPNRAARALVTSRSRTIGVLSATTGEYGPSSSIAAIEDAAREAGYFVNTANLAASTPAAIVDALKHLVLQDVEGLIVMAPQVRVFDVLAGMAIDIPYVSLQSTGQSDHRALAVDQIAGARAATQHLIDLGHHEIVHLAGPQDWIEAEARMRGFLDAIIDADLRTHPPILGDWTADFGYYAGPGAQPLPGLQRRVRRQRPHGDRPDARVPGCRARRSARRERRRLRRHPRRPARVAAAHDGAPGVPRGGPSRRRPAARRVARRTRGASEEIVPALVVRGSSGPVHAALVHY